MNAVELLFVQISECIMLTNTTLLYIVFYDLAFSNLQYSSKNPVVILYLATIMTWSSPT